MYPSRIREHILVSGRPSDVSMRLIINASQAFAMILIIAYHIHMQLAPLRLTHWRFSHLFGYFAIFLMPMFFLFAGLSLSRVWNLDSRCFAKSRLVSYLWIFLVWSLIYACENILLGLAHGKNIQSLVTIELQNIAYPVSSLWFVYNLCIYIAISSFISHQNRYLFMAGVLFAQVFCSIYGHLELDRFLKCLLFFLAGYMLPMWIRRLVTVVSVQRAIIALMIYTAVYFLSAISNVALGSFLGDVATFIGIYWFSQASMIAYRLFDSGYLTKIANSNLPMYLLHMPILLLFVEIIKFFSLSSSSIYVIVVFPIFMLALTLISCLKAHEVLRTYSSLFVPPYPARRIGTTILTRMSAVLHRRAILTAQ